MDDEMMVDRELTSSPEPVESPVPDMEVISVAELLARLAEQEDAAEEVPEASPSPEPTPGPVEVVGTDETIQLLGSIQEDVTPHPFLTTPFDDYTVTEGLLLLILLLFVTVWATAGFFPLAVFTPALNALLASMPAERVIRRYLPEKEPEGEEL